MRTLALLVITLLAPLAPAAEQTVYRSVENGVTTFSDTPPVDGTAEEILIVPPPPSRDGELEQRLAAMRETTDRMADDRRERERHRAELRALRDEAGTTAPSADPAADPSSFAYWPSPVIRPRPPLRPYPPLRPRPPLRPMPVPPGWSVLKPGNAQLMRPLVSRRSARQYLR